MRIDEALIKWKAEVIVKAHRAGARRIPRDAAMGIADGLRHGRTMEEVFGEGAVALPRDTWLRIGILLRTALRRGLRLISKARGWLR